MTHIEVTREKNFPVVARPGPEWRWSYQYRVDGGPVQQYGPGLDSLRSRLRRKYPDAKITYTWK